MKIGDIVTVEISPCVLEQGEVAYTYTSGMVMLKNGTTPRWPVGSKVKLLEKENEYANLFANPYNAAQRGFIDEVIMPKDTRRKLIKAFAMLENKVSVTPNRKHGNIPL